MKKIWIASFLTLLSTLVVLGAVSAQSNELTLKLSRDFGYAGFSNDIEGLFSMHVTGPADLVRVEFYIDQTKIGEVDNAPFNLQFTTDDYPLGVRQMYAVGYSASGQTYHSNSVSANFVPKQNTLKFILPVLVIVLLAVLLSAFGPLLFGRGKRAKLPLGTERNYGIRGGTICPKCKRPFALPLMSMHVGFSTLTACPYCGKFSLVRGMPIEKLRDAEKAELAKAQPGAGVGPEVEHDNDKKELDDSKFQD